jgi:hypothetical protein
MIGTPFYSRDEILNRRVEAMDKKPWEQEGRDELGRKHFYGAFTGALNERSVGFKGTVGSREGMITDKSFFNKNKCVYRLGTEVVCQFES